MAQFDFITNQDPTRQQPDKNDILKGNALYKVWKKYIDNKKPTAEMLRREVDGPQGGKAYKSKY